MAGPGQKKGPGDKPDKEEKVDFSERETRPIVPVVRPDAGSEGPTRRISRISTRASRVTGVITPVRGRDHIDAVLEDVAVSDDERVDLYRALSVDWAVVGPTQDEVLADDSLLRKIKLVTRMHELIPGSRFLTRNFFENEGRRLDGSISFTGVVLKVDLSGFTKRLAGAEAEDGDASVVAGPIDADLTAVTNICRVNNFSLVSLGGDAATFISTHPEGMSYATEATNLIRVMCPINAGATIIVRMNRMPDRGGNTLEAIEECCERYGYEVSDVDNAEITFLNGEVDSLDRELEAELAGIFDRTAFRFVNRRSLNHNFTSVAARGAIDVRVIKAAEDRSLFRISGAALDEVDRLEKDVAPGRSKVTSLMEIPVVDIETMISETLEKFPSIREFDKREVHGHMNNLIAYLETFLRTDFSIVSALEHGDSMQVRDHSVIMMNLHGLDKMYEQEFFQDIFHQISLLGGVIYKVEGEVLIALFPKHIASKGYVRKAYEFAQYCLEHYPNVPAAVTSGALLEASMGPDGSKEWGALGIAINRAARIMVYCSRPGHIAVDGETYMTIKGDVLDEIGVSFEDGFKGLGTTKVVKVRGIAEQSNRPITKNMHDLSAECLGREDQLDEVSSVLTQHFETPGASTIYLRGAAGSGKKLFLAKAGTSSNEFMSAPIVEHNGELFQRPYVGCVSLLRSIRDQVGDLESLELEDDDMVLLRELLEGNISSVSSPAKLQHLFVAVLTALEDLNIHDLVFVLTNINFWDPPSVEVMNGVHSYFSGTGSMRILFVFSENTTVQDTRVSERESFLDDFKREAEDNCGLLELRDLDKEETGELVSRFAKVLKAGFSGRIHEGVVDFVCDTAKGNPSDIKRLTEILVHEGVLTDEVGVDIGASLRQLRQKDSLFSSGISLTYIDYLGFENSEEVKDLVKTFALLGAKFPLKFVRTIVEDFGIGNDLSRDLDVILGRLASNGILTVEDGIVGFKHPGNRTDFRGSIPVAQRKQLLLKAIRQYRTGHDGSHLINISRFHWMKELLELSNGGVAAGLKAELLEDMAFLTDAVCSVLSRDPGNQASIIYYCNVLFERMGVTTGKSLGSTSFDTRSSLARAHSYKAGALLGIGTTDKANLAEHHYREAVDLSQGPDEVVRNLVGVVRAQVMREVDMGREAMMKRSEDLVGSSAELEYFRAGISLENDLDSEAKLLAATVKYRELAQKTKDVDVIAGYIRELEDLEVANRVYLDANLPMQAWLLFTRASLHDKRAMLRDEDKSLILSGGLRRQELKMAIMLNERAHGVIEKYPNLVEMMRVFPNIADPSILARRSAMNLSATYGSDSHERSIWLDHSLWFSKIACDLAERAGAHSNLIKALEGRNLVLIARGMMDEVIETNERVLKTARLIGSRKYVASSEFIALLGRNRQAKDLQLLEYFGGRCAPTMLEGQIGALGLEGALVIYSRIAEFAVAHPVIEDDYVKGKFDELVGMFEARYPGINRMVDEKVE
jgi:hypothetical protein